MADDIDEVTIRHPDTLEEKTVHPNAVGGFPGWVLLDKAGRVKANQTVPTTKES